MFKNILENIQNKSPLIHNITNYVTVNDCANMLLACGGSPIMADDPLEVKEITSICDGLVINVGTLNSHTIESMIIAGKKANELNHPIILDPVGIGASKLRTETVKRLLKEIRFTVIRGNVSEIKSISMESGKTKGVDALDTDKITEENINGTIRFVKKLSEETGAIIVMTGAIDIVSDKQKAFVIRNGHPIMSKITGTGCMLTSILGAYCSANQNNLLDAAATAVCSMGICGEMAYERMVKMDGGTSSFKMYLIDFMSNLTATILERKAKMEELIIEFKN